MDHYAEKRGAEDQAAEAGQPRTYAVEVEEEHSDNLHDEVQEADCRQDNAQAP